jgi:hypothetical protein
MGLTLIQVGTEERRQVDHTARRKGRRVSHRWWLIRMSVAAEVKRAALGAGVCLALACGREAFAQSALPAGPSSIGGTATPSVLSDACGYTAEEQAILGGVGDGDSEFETTGLYILLEHAARFSGSPEETAARVDPPGIDNLWSQPAAYRGRLIAVRGHYAGLTEERKVADNPWYQGSFFLLHMKVPKAREAIVVALTQRPPAFRLGQPIEVTGFMYKTVAWQTREDGGDGGPWRLFPVLVANSVAEAGVPDPVQNSHRTMYMALAATGVLILMLAIRLSRVRSMRPVDFIQPERETPPAGDPDEVDPELRRAVEESQSDKL